MQIFRRIWKNTWPFAGLPQFHKYYRPFIILVILLFVSLNSIADSENPRTIPLHHFDLPCQSCHSASVTNSYWLNNQNQKPQLITANINQTCTSSLCHEYNTILNHPLNVLLPDDIQTSYQRQTDADMTCLTCHLNAAATKAGEEQTSPDRLLSVPDDPQFCDSCHLRMSGNAKLRSHWQFTQKAHLGKINLQSDFADNVDASLGAIDEESHACLACHDDITVTVPAYNETKREKYLRWQNMADHPIAMEYGPIAMRNIREFFYPIMDSGKVRLFNGKVGCGSCHSLYAQTEKHLVIQNHQSRLCRSCHNK